MCAYRAPEKAPLAPSIAKAIAPRFSLRDTPEYAMGRAGEMEIGRRLQEQGWYVVPVYDYCGQGESKAPRLQGADGRAYCLPDLDVCRKGKRIWVEVKTKQSASLHRATGRWEHGISARLHGHYKAVQEITGCPVWVFVRELDTGVTLRGAMDDLDKEMRVYSGGKMSRGGMVFWPRSAFKVWP